VTSRRVIRYAAAWLVAALVAVAVGVFAVTSAGAGIRDRGPLGTGLPGVAPDATYTPDPAAERVRTEIDDAYGTFVVECRGSVAYGVEARPDEAGGWRVVSYETGPDDDVDAVFAKGPRSIEVEVFCNRGRPTVADREEHVLDEDDD
jgi:hypothetical protein